MLDDVVRREVLQVDDTREAGPATAEDDGEDAEDDGDGVGDVEDFADRGGQLCAGEILAVTGSLGLMEMSRQDAEGEDGGKHSQIAVVRQRVHRRAWRAAVAGTWRDVLVGFGVVHGRWATDG